MSNRGFKGKEFYIIDLSLPSDLHQMVDSGEDNYLLMNKLVIQSRKSMQGLFEVSGDELDYLLSDKWKDLYLNAWINGAFLFNFADGRGVPLGMAFQMVRTRFKNADHLHIDTEGNIRFHVPSFIERARDCGWLDDKIIDYLYYELIDEVDSKRREEVVNMCKCYMVRHLHPLIDGKIFNT